MAVEKREMMGHLRLSCWLRRPKRLLTQHNGCSFLVQPGYLVDFCGRGVSHFDLKLVSVKFAGLAWVLPTFSFVFCPTTALMANMLVRSYWQTCLKVLLPLSLFLGTRTHFAVARWEIKMVFESGGVKIA